MISSNFKTGDRIIVHTCPRGNSEIDWTGTVTRTEEGRVYVIIDDTIFDMGVPITYIPENIRLLTPLDNLL